MQMQFESERAETSRETEQRSDRRYLLRRPCRVLLPLNPRGFDGMTRNVSRNGLLIEIHPAPVRPFAKVGTVVEVILELPHQPPHPAKILHGTGAVCRIEDSGDSHRLAVKLFRPWGLPE